MTKLGEEMKFSSECSSNLFRLPVCKGKGSFVINSARNSISSIESDNQKLKQTWTLPHPHLFTSPVAFCETDGTISCVKNNNVLMIWPISATDLNSATKVKFKNSIYAVLSVNDAITVVVFANGEASTIEHIISNPDAFNSNSPVLEENEEIVWVDAFVHSKDVMIAFVTCKKNKSGFMIRSSVIKEGNNTATSSHCSLIDENKDVLKSWCISGTSSPSLLTLWSSGKVKAFSLVGESMNDLFTTNVNCNSPIAIDTLDKSHLALVKFNSSTNQNVLEIWDLTYCIRKSLKVLKQRLSKNLQMKSFESSLFLLSDNRITVIAVELCPSTLAAVMGKSMPVPSDKQKSFCWTTDGALITEACAEENKPSSSNLSCQKFSEMLSTSPAVKADFMNEFPKMKDISEQELIKMLQFSLTFEDGSDDNDGPRNVESQNELINNVFKVSFTDSFLRQNLKQLSFKETMVCLLHLVELLNRETFEVENSDVPSDFQIVNWMQLLIQSHFDEIVVCTDENFLKLLKMIQVTLQKKMEIYTELQEIRNLVKLIRKKNILPEKKKDEKYSIETLFF